jgi:hypothetical protein
MTTLPPAVAVRATLLNALAAWTPRNAHPMGLTRLLEAMIRESAQSTVPQIMLRAFGRYACRPLRRSGGRFTPKQYSTAITATLIGMLAHADPHLTTAEIAVALGLSTDRAVSRTLHLAHRNARAVARGIPLDARTVPYLRQRGDRAAQWFLRPLLKRERASYWRQDLRATPKRRTA